VVVLIYEMRHRGCLNIILVYFTSFGCGNRGGSCEGDKTVNVILMRQWRFR
jgi:hypothetical protein